MDAALSRRECLCLTAAGFVAFFGLWSVLAASGILFARSGFTGTGAYPAGWPGDENRSVLGSEVVSFPFCHREVWLKNTRRL